MEFKSIFDFIQSIPDEAACVQYLEEMRWAGVVVSPFDETSKVYKCKNGYKCKNTGKYFNVKVGTIFEDTKIPLTKWFMALYIFATHKKGISSYQLATDLTVTQKTAWFMLHRLRFMFDHPSTKELLSGVVEVDETYVGGKAENMHKKKRINMNSKVPGSTNKTPVVALLERDGRVIVKKADQADSTTLKGLVYKHVGLGSSVMTDSARQYHGLQGSFQHGVINHNKDEYVSGITHTNTVEGFFSNLKRTIYGTYHFCSRKHLQAYCNEVSLRYNTRKARVNQRFDFVLTNMENRLTYKALIA